MSPWWVMVIVLLTTSSDEVSPARQVERPQAGKGGSYWMFIAMLSCGEIGDKSQITAIALAASYTPLSVIVGGALVLPPF